MSKNRPKATAEQTATFLESFVRIKTEKTGRKNTTRGISDTTSRNLRTLLDRGYTPEEMEDVITEAITRDYVLTNNLDNPDHVLREANFDRYYNAVQAKKQAKAEQQEVKEKLAAVIEPKTFKKVIEKQTEAATDPELVEQSMKLYSNSLEAGKWIGDTLDAINIARMFADEFTKEEKQAFWNQANEMVVRERKSDAHRTGGGQLRDSFVRMARQHPNNVFSQIIVEKAAERKIPEPWLDK